MISKKYVGFQARMLAHNIDLVILIPFFYLLGWFIADNILLIACCWILYVIYHVIFELTAWRGTPGKKTQRIIVSSDNDLPISIWQIIFRNMAKIISILLLFAGVFMIAIDAKHRGLHDRIAGTVVIFC